MVLDDEGAMEAERFGLDVIVDESRKPSALSNSPLPLRAAALPNRPNRIGVFLLSRFGPW